MSQKQNTHPTITTIDGAPDLSAIQANELVSVQPDGARAILLPAGQVLTADRTPIAEAPDGATPRLDGEHVIKLGGEVIAASNHNK